MSGDLVFYTNPMSRGRIARWMLEEVGAPYETVLLDFSTTAKTDEYLRLNPMGKVPAIVHRGHVVTECAAICAYLAEAFPDAGLAPAEDERADYYRWLFFAAGPLEQAVVNHSLGLDPPAERRAMVGYGSYDLAVDTLETAVSAHPYVAGERFTAADVYVGSQIGWGMSFGALPKRPAFEAYMGRIFMRPAAVRARQIDDDLIAKAAQPA
ncbi:glutathione S-transferase family protein [Phenylobacterium sp.]|uniref:glutathione S-transferase family protein n=1 Tax=Phenylobacterium sp. TaxID=1871053 RepID=UPI0035AEA784